MAGPPVYVSTVYAAPMSCPASAGAAETLVRQSIDEYLKDGRDNLQVAFGCTGNAPAAKRSGCLSAKREPQRGRKGPRQYRSVYFAERIAERLAGTDDVEVEVSHVAKPHWKW